MLPSHQHATASVLHAANHGCVIAVSLSPTTCHVCHATTTTLSPTTCHVSQYCGRERQREAKEAPLLTALVHTSLNNRRATVLNNIIPRSTHNIQHTELCNPEKQHVFARRAALRVAAVHAHSQHTQPLKKQQMLPRGRQSAPSLINNHIQHTHTTPEK